MEIDDSNEEYSNNTSNSDNCNCEDYTRIMDLNKLSVNMIIAQESLLLDIIDSIPDKEQKRNLIEKVIEANKEKKLKPKMEAIVNPSYTMTEVLDRMKKEKPITLNDLKHEINKLKEEVKQLRKRIEVLELVKEVDNDDYEENNLDIMEDLELQIGETSKSKEENIDYLNIIEQTITRKYILRLIIIINKEFTLKTLALVDTGADRNII